MIIFKKKNYLKRNDFISLVDSKKIWHKTLTIEEIANLLKQFKQEILKHDFVFDSDFIMTERRRGLKDAILNRNYNNYEADIKESLFNFWEFITDGDMYSILISRELNIPMKKLDKMIRKYEKKGIICLQEKNVIIEMIDSIESYINR